MGISNIVILSFMIKLTFVYGALTTSKHQQISPVILVPGQGGNRLEAKLDNKPHVPHRFCQKNSDWYNLWLNVAQFEPQVVECFVDNGKLIYDSSTHTTKSPEGVEIRVPGFGDPSVVEYLNPSLHIQPYEYFKTIIDALVEAGWQKNKSIRAAPYDFRKGPNENAQWIYDVKNLIEDAFIINEQVPVTIICHAMGCPMSQLFLTGQTDEWKEKYIANYITLSAGWGGTVKSLKIFAIGDDLGFPIVKKDFIRPLLASMPSLAFTLPSPEFWNSSHIFVHTPSRDYTLGQLKDFFDAIKYPTGWEMAIDQSSYINRANSPPNVPVHCIYGSGIQTVRMLKYRTNDLINDRPFLAPGDGDGTVNLRSLRGCLNWRNHQSQPVSSLEIQKVSHMDILADHHAIDYILTVLNNYDPLYRNNESLDLKE